MRLLLFITLLLIIVVANADYNNLECTICTYGVSEVEYMLNNNKTIYLIENELDNFCNYFSFRNQCSSLVKQYLPTIIGDLEQKYNPDQVCHLLGFCPNDFIFPKANNSVCIYIVSMAEAFFTYQTPYHQIQSELYKGCSLLPKILDVQCTYYVREYFIQFMDLLIHKYPASVICSYL